MAPPPKDEDKKGTKGKTTKKTPPKKVKSDLADLRSICKSVFPKDSPFVSIDGNKLRKSLPHLPTGSIVVDFTIGGQVNKHGVMPCPGFPRGKLVNLYGRESAGKTTLALTAAAATIQGGGSVCFVDWEYAVDLAYAEALGVPVANEHKFALAQPQTLEQGLKVLWVAAKRGIPLIVIDSVSAGVPEALHQQKLAEKGGTGRIGEVARLWSAFLPQLNSVIAKTGSCVVGISQLRKKIQKMGYGGSDGDGTAGGESWKFYSELRLGLKPIGREKGTVYDPLTHKMVETAVSNTTLLTIDKCKLSGSQGRQARFYIRYGKGIDDVRSVIDIAAAHGVIKKSGSWYSWERVNGDILKVQGKDALRDAIGAADGAWPELYKKTLNEMVSGSKEDIEMVPVDEDFSDFDAILTGATESDED